MPKVDGYARVITNHEKKIIHVIDFHWNHPQLYNCMGDDEIMDNVYELSIEDAEILIPLTYHHQEGHWVGADWSDPEEYLYVVEQYVLQREFKNHYMKEIQTAWRDEHDWRYVDDMIKHYEELYGEKVDLENLHESRISVDRKE